MNPSDDGPLLECPHGPKCLAMYRPDSIMRTFHETGGCVAALDDSLREARHSS